ncbi:hypothetical protein FE64_15205, partial [Staphylococcus aureus]
DVHGQAGARDQVGDDHVFHAQAAARHEAVAVLDAGVAQALQGRLDLGVQRRRPFGVEADGVANGRRRGPGQAADLAHAALLRNHGRVSPTSPW